MFASRTGFPLNFFLPHPECEGYEVALMNSRTWPGFVYTECYAGNMLIIVVLHLCYAVILTTLPKLF